MAVNTKTKCLSLTSAHWPRSTCTAVSGSQWLEESHQWNLPFLPAQQRCGWRPLRAKLDLTAGSSCHQYRRAKAIPSNPSPLSEISFKPNDKFCLRIYNDTVVLYIDSALILFLEAKALCCQEALRVKLHTSLYFFITFLHVHVASTHIEE